MNKIHDLTATSSGRRFLKILAIGFKKRLEELGLENTPVNLKLIVDKARESGQNAGYVLEPVRDEIEQFQQEVPFDDIEAIHNAFTYGDKCQRGTVMKIVLGLVEP